MVLMKGKQEVREGQKQPGEKADGGEDKRRHPKQTESVRCVGAGVGVGVFVGRDGQSVAWGISLLTNTAVGMGWSVYLLR